MGVQLTDSAEALRLFFTEDIYLVNSDERVVPAAEPKITAIIAAVPETVVPAVFKYLGKNQKNVLILVNDLVNDVSTERGRELLRNLVKALQLTANDFALLNYANHAKVTFEELHGFFSSRLVLAFGVSPVHLGLADLPLHMISLHGAAQLVFTGNLDQLAIDQEGKKILWGSLKQIEL